MKDEQEQNNELKKIRKKKEEKLKASKETD